MGRKRLTASISDSGPEWGLRTPPFEWLFYQPHCTTTLFTLLPLKYCHAYSLCCYMYSWAVCSNPDLIQITHHMIELLLIAVICVLAWFILREF